MSYKLCIVTGANRGIGKGIAIGLAEKGHQVVMVCRNIKQGEEVQNEILKRYTNASIDVIKGDLSSIRTVKELGDRILERYDEIDVVIHNAGIWPSKVVLNEDGLELAFMVNHIAPFYLDHLLLPKLQESAPSRIVLVNAGLYPRGYFDPELTPYGKDFSRLKSYMNSKFCSILYMRKVAPLLAEKGVTINAVHPGVIRTGLGEFKGFLGVMLKFFRIFQRSIKTGAEAPINLGINSEIKTNGKYYNKLVEEPFAEKVLDEELVNLLWNTSLQICKIANFISF